MKSCKVGKHQQLNSKSIDELPTLATEYVRRIENLIGAPISLVSTSPEREDTILIQNPFE